MINSICFLMKSYGFLMKFQFFLVKSLVRNRPCPAPFPRPLKQAPASLAQIELSLGGTEPICGTWKIVKIVGKLRETDDDPWGPIMDFGGIHTNPSPRALI